jgi:hypothetical protein
MWHCLKKLLIIGWVFCKVEYNKTYLKKSLRDAAYFITEVKQLHINVIPL